MRGIKVPSSSEKYSAVGKVRKGRKTSRYHLGKGKAERRSIFGRSNARLSVAHLIRFGSIKGSRLAFSSSSSIRASFHWSRWICHVPRPNVKIGMKPSTRVVGDVQLNPDLPEG